MSYAPRGPATLVPAALVLGAALLLSGCSSGGDGHAAGPAHGHPAGHPSGHPHGSMDHGGMSGSAAEPGARPAALTRIADAIGCHAAVTTDADELRQGSCRTRTGQYRMLTFAAEAGKHAWLTEAQAYGGTYLVGDRWAVTTQSAAALKDLRGKLGGSLVNGASHHGM